MKARATVLALFLIACSAVDSPSQTLPLVYDAENTGANWAAPLMPSFSDLPTINPLPDPFLWADGRGRLVNVSDWRYRRTEISAELQHYQLGDKPAPPSPDSLQAVMSGDTLVVTIVVGGKSLTLHAIISLPASGTGPFPAVIGIGSPTGSLPADIFTTRGIATITYNFGELAPWGQSRGQGGFFRLFPDPKVGYYTAWSWGVSRIIDGLQKTPAANIDVRHLAITGCSFAGKMALYAGALDERIALTIGQESGGGGMATWRFSQTIGSTVEILANAQGYGWYYQDVSQFNNAVNRLPFDQHEVMAMVAPRALYMTGNPSYVWLADESGYVGCKAAKEVYNALGVPDRFGYSIVGGHTHCQLPTSQDPDVVAFVEKYLLGQDTANTADISTNPGYTTDLTPWITWSTPILANGSSFYGRASLVFPANLQKGLDKNPALQWNRLPGADQYFIQLSTSPAFASIVQSDSTTDTTLTVSGLADGTLYYWRVEGDSAHVRGPWSSAWSFSTYIPLPAAPQIVSASPTYPDRSDYTSLRWRRTQFADTYQIELSQNSDFGYVFFTTATADTVDTVSVSSQGVTFYWRVKALNVTGSSDWSDSSFVVGTADVPGLKRPAEYALSQNYPNPFNPTTTITYAVKQSSRVELNIYNSLGELIRTLVNDFNSPGAYSVQWDGRDGSGKVVPSGSYFYRIKIGTFVSAKKMIYMK